MKLPTSIRFTRRKKEKLRKKAKNCMLPKKRVVVVRGIACRISVEQWTLRSKIRPCWKRTLLVLRCTNHVLVLSIVLIDQ